MTGEQNEDIWTLKDSENYLPLNPFSRKEWNWASLQEKHPGKKHGFQESRLNILLSLKSRHTEICPFWSYNKSIRHCLLQDTCIFWSLFGKLLFPRYQHDLPLQLSQVLFNCYLILKGFPNHLPLHSHPTLTCSFSNPLSCLIGFHRIHRIHLHLITDNKCNT